MADVSPLAHRVVGSARATHAAFFAAAVGLAIGGSPRALPAAEIELHALAFQSERVPFVRVFRRWTEEVNARCRAVVTIRVSGPEDTPTARQWHALTTGQVDVYYGPANYYRGALHEGDVFNLARTPVAEQRRNGAWSLLNQRHNDALNAWYLTSLSDGVRFFVYTSKPAREGRFEGHRLRITPLHEGFLRSLGAEPRYLPASDVEAALAGGELDGYVWPLWSGGLGWEKHVSYRYGPGFLNAASPILVNLDRWRSLSELQRRCLTDAAQWAETQWPQWRTQEDAHQEAALRASGIEYVELGPEFAQTAEAMYWAMLEKAEPEFVRTIRPLLAP